jgi:hypothetical protein
MSDKTVTPPEAVERYSPTSTKMVNFSTEGDMKRDPDGEWVSFDDYRAQAERIAELEAQALQAAGQSFALQNQDEIRKARIGGMQEARARAEGLAEALCTTISDFNSATTKVPESIDAELRAARKIEASITDMIEKEESQ